MAKHTSIEVLRDIMLGGAIYADVEHKNPDPTAGAIPGIRYNAGSWQYNNVSGSKYEWKKFSDGSIFIETELPTIDNLSDYNNISLVITDAGEAAIVDPANNNIIPLTIPVIKNSAEINQNVNSGKLITAKVFKDYINTVSGTLQTNIDNKPDILTGAISDNTINVSAAVSPKQVTDYVSSYVLENGGKQEVFFRCLLHQRKP